MTALAISLLVGLVLLIRGLRGRRIGSVPYCRKCGYNLTALESNHCPECGLEPVGSNVVIGHRRRRRASLAVGVGLILVSAAGIGALTYVGIQDIDPYRQFPKTLLVKLALAEDIRAIDELTRRIVDGELAANGISQLIPIALDRQPSASTSPARSSWIDLLGAVEQVAGLATKQRERFFRQLVTLTVKVRPRIRRGDALVVHLSYSVDQPEGITGTLVIDEAGLHAGSGFQADLSPAISDTFAGCGCSSTEVYEISSEGLAEGRYRFEYRARQTVYAGPVVGPNASPVVSEPVTIIHEIEVLPLDGPGSVAVVEDPGLAADLHQIMKIGSPYRTSGTDGVYEIEIEVDGPTPVGVAFDVIAEVDTQSLNLGAMTFSRSEWHTEVYSWSLPSAVPLGEEWSLVLRTSVAAAETTLDLFEIWDGELRFDPVPNR